MSDDGWWLARFVGGFVLALCALLGLVGISRETSYSFWTGCYVRVGEDWVPDQNWRIFEEPR